MLLASLCLSAPAVHAGETDVGKALFGTHCVSCHGVNGDGKGPATRDMDRNPRSFIVAEFKFDTDADWQRGTDADITNTISQGTLIYGGSPLIPAWGKVLSRKDIADLVAYIRTLENRTPASAGMSTR